MLPQSGAGLLVQSLLSLERVNPGFNPDRVLSFNISLPSLRYPTDAKVVAAVTEIENRLQSDPRVQHAGAVTGLPLKGSVYTGSATIEGRPAGEYQRELWHKAITPDFFRAIGAPLLRGRMLDEHDGQPGGLLVTMVNQTLARTYFPNEDAIGKRIKFGRPNEKDPWVVIVGVVADAKQDGMDKPVQPEVYVPFADDSQSSLSFVLRSSADPAELAALVRREVHSFDKDLVPAEIAPMRELVSGSLHQERFRTALLSGFAAAALLLAAIGIYGVLAYLVTQRTREIGIRMALGAQQPQLLALIFRQGMFPVVCGIVLGIAGAVGCARLIRTMLFGIDATNPVTYIAAAAILLTVAMCACYFPARRAAKVDPMVALREG
jgi:predicted permease